MVIILFFSKRCPKSIVRWKFRITLSFLLTEPIYVLANALSAYQNICWINMTNATRKKNSLKQFIYPNKKSSGKFDASSSLFFSHAITVSCLAAEKCQYILSQWDQQCARVFLQCKYLLTVFFPTKQSRIVGWTFFLFVDSQKWREKYDINKFLQGFLYKSWLQWYWFRSQNQENNSYQTIFFLNLPKKILEFNEFWLELVSNYVISNKIKLDTLN